MGHKNYVLLILLIYYVKECKIHLSKNNVEAGKIGQWINALVTWGSSLEFIWWKRRAVSQYYSWLLQVVKKHENNNKKPKKFLNKTATQHEVCAPIRHALECVPNIIPENWFPLPQHLSVTKSFLVRERTLFPLPLLCAGFCLAWTWADLVHFCSNLSSCVLVQLWLEGVVSLESTATSSSYNLSVSSSI